MFAINTFCSLNLMIFTQVQNFAARWQQWGVLIVASIVRNHINSLEQLINHNIHINMFPCWQFRLQNYLLHRNHKKVSKINHDTLVIYFSVEVALSLDLLHSFKCEGKISNSSMRLMCSDFRWFLMNVKSKYLFLEQFCQFSEGVLKFLSEAWDSIHSFSSCTHIGALKTEWKCRIS